MSKNAMIGGIVGALAGMSTNLVSVILEVTQCLTRAGGPVSPYRDRVLKAVRGPLPQGEPKQYKILRPVEDATMGILNPQADFYNDNNKEIWLSERFSENILSVAEPFQPTADLPLPRGFDLKERGNDEDVRDELPDDHVITSVGEFCWQLKRMTEAQPNGTPGRLLNNGYANIFYVVGKGDVVSSVFVYWHTDDRKWSFDFFTLGVHRWLQGDRAFSRN